MKKITFILLLFVSNNLMSQSMVTGEYYFRRQELVAGFNFSTDGKFQFFYTYGAVDRNATGTFVVDGDLVKLTSDKAAGKDFTIQGQSKQPKGYSVVFKDASQFLIKNILCVFFIDGKKLEAHSDSEGVVNMDLPNCDTIYVQHSLFPDIFTLIKDKKNNNKRFVLTLNPSLAQVSFKGIDFKIVSENEIACFPNYFMNLPDIKFLKQ